MIKYVSSMVLYFTMCCSAYAAPTVNKGDVAWVMTSAALVFMMVVPGLALFYGGLVRTKNMLSMLSQVFACVVLAAILWIFYGYSITFTSGNGTFAPFFGGLNKAFLIGVSPESISATFSVDVALPEYAFIVFQMAFACVTGALIVGAFAERIKFSAMLLFMVGWLSFSYFPIAHMVWYWAGPDALAEAAKALLLATESKNNTAIEAAQLSLSAIQADSGYIYSLGALDFAGGTVVHINSGIAGLVGALVVGRRIGYGKESLTPHSLSLSLVGAALLWVGWIGFNAGSALEANGGAALAFMNTCTAAAAAALVWMLIEWVHHGKPSLLGMITGAVAGLVAITPAAGFSAPAMAIILGGVGSLVSYYFCSYVKKAFKYDDSLDVFGVHGVAGIVGAIGTGVVAAPSLGGTGVIDYTANGGKGAIAAYDIYNQVMIQSHAVAITIIWSALVSIILFIAIKYTIGIRVSSDAEREGLDLSSHGERAYNMY